MNVVLVTVLVVVVVVLVTVLMLVVAVTVSVETVTVDVTGEASTLCTVVSDRAELFVMSVDVFRLTQKLSWLQ